MAGFLSTRPLENSAVASNRLVRERYPIVVTGYLVWRLGARSETWRPPAGNLMQAHAVSLLL